MTTRFIEFSRVSLGPVHFVGTTPFRTGTQSDFSDYRLLTYVNMSIRNKKRGKGGRQIEERNGQ